MTSVRDVLAKSMIESIGAPWPWDEMPSEARALWRGHAEAVIEEFAAAGYTVVPVEPTPAMSKRGSTTCLSETSAVECWRAMLAGAPKP
jgi:hypothetical protein